MEVQGQLQPLLPLVGADGELLPHPVESRQSVAGRARRAAQRLAEDDGRLQKLAAVIVCALRKIEIQLEKQSQLQISDKTNVW